ncbi:hypothetical protein RhiJN_19475 [Ceratobasidium sp. AG-Ba]|nr:hypothetical protein RhiJN_19475 [Ceratobasidium sp. AG-Ba]
MASSETVTFNAPHPPQARAIEAFNEVLPKIKLAVISSRNEWDIHEPRMWSRASGLSDPELSSFDIENDLVEVRVGATSYGTIILGKIRSPLSMTPKVKDSYMLGFTTHPTMYEFGTEDVLFHSLFTDEGNRDADGKPTTFRAIQTRDTPLEFFNE